MDGSTEYPSDTNILGRHDDDVIMLQCIVVDVYR